MDNGTLKSKLKSGFLYFDGAMGTMLQKAGLSAGEMPESFNLNNRRAVIDIHRAYATAGSDIITANTFGLNTIKAGVSDTDEKTACGFSLSELICAAVENAKTAICRFEGRFIAFDVGPTGKILAPFGDLDFEDAVACYKKSIEIAADCGVDLIIIETMSDLYEAKAALLAAKEVCDLPVFVTLTFDGKTGRLLTGADVPSVVATLEGLGADGIGVNCGTGPALMGDIARDFVAYSSLPVILMPNAGLPVSTGDGQPCKYSLGADEFAVYMREFASIGVSVMGGCCGTTPEYIEKTVAATRTVQFFPPAYKDKTLVSSYTHAVEIGGMTTKTPVIIGERINPTGKPRLKEALKQRDFAYLLRLAAEEEDNGAHILDINVGIPGGDEKALLTEAVKSIQSISALPLQLDSADPAALEAAMRIYNGKPLVNSVNGKQDTMRAVFPLVKKYGGVLVALTLDEDGIPEDAWGRMMIYEKICRIAAEYGIAQKDIIADPLTLAVSADKSAADTTLSALTLINKSGGKTILGVSNVSFGLPERDTVNGVFFAAALDRGLDAAIINPNSDIMMRTYYSYLAIKGIDEKCMKYIGYCEKCKSGTNAATTQSKEVMTLCTAIIRGLSREAAAITSELLKSDAPTEIIDNMLIPALDIVGERFEEKKLYLPQLLISADAANAAFDIIRANLAAEGKIQKSKGRIILATVEGDIHDIGKNIVKALLENYNFEVLDLGRNVAPSLIAETAEREKIKLVGLSALMTTTLPAMEKTVSLLRQSTPDCKVAVGGAVLTADFAAQIGADRYCRDAMDTVRYATELFSE